MSQERDNPNETMWEIPLPRQTLEHVVTRGWIEAPQAEAELSDYEGGESQVTFASYLLARGLISLEQLSELQAEEPHLAPRSQPIVPGAIFSGCEIVKKLGQGGMGTVYLARRSSDGVEVVVKFLNENYVRNTTWRSRFLREAIAARKIIHPNVVQVFAVEANGDQPHLVMELVSGADLEERLEQEQHLPPLEVARIGRDAARALAAAHASGVIHRDMKPGNVRLSATGEVKLLDFGLAKLIETDDGVSLAGQILGTPFYMAPEQWGEHGVDARVDVFSLGATLYHLATGQVPFPGERPITILRKSENGLCARPSELRPGLPEGLELAILRMLAVDPRARFQTAEACAEALDAVLEERPVQAPILEPLRPPGPPIPLVPRTSWVLGRSEGADVFVPDMHASRTHARIVLRATGFLLTDLESSAGTFVNGARISEVTLKAGDVIRCGETAWRFHDGGVVSRRSSVQEHGGGRLRVSTLPQPFIDVLAARRDRRLVISLLERVPRALIDARVEASRAWLRETYGDGALAEAVGRLLEQRLLKARQEATGLLFAISFENLLDDSDAWLGWWDERSADYPPQLAPQRLQPRVRLRLVGSDPPRLVELTGKLRTRIGREDDCDLRLNDRSVSRRHATILRLHQHLMVRDDGSRFGTLVNDRPVVSALLTPGDVLKLASAELVLEAEDLTRRPPATPAGVLLIDPDLFWSLVEHEHASVLAGLHAFLPLVEDLDWVDRQAARLFDDAEAVRACVAEVRAAYVLKAEQARTLLPRLVPALASAPDWRAWAPLLYERAAELPTQVLPVGWLQPSR